MADAKTSSPAKRKPIHIITLDDISVSIFAELRTNKNGHTWKSYSCSLQRSYIDAKSGERKYTNSLYGTNLLAASEALVKAYHFTEEGQRKFGKTVAREDEAADES